MADITYIRLREEFIFLAVILDAYSRRVIGWALDRTMEDDLTLTALRMALAAGASGPAWCTIPTAARSTPATDYTDLLKDHGIDISMSPQRKSLGQRGLRIVHENVEIRGGVPQ